MSAKDILLEVAEKLPSEATLNDAIYELEFRQAVQQGLDELDRAKAFPLNRSKPNRRMGWQVIIAPRRKRI